jgi:hypothetical protein
VEIFYEAGFDRPGIDTNISFFSRMNLPVMPKLNLYVQMFLSNQTRWTARNTLLVPKPQSGDYFPTILLSSSFAPSFCQPLHGISELVVDFINCGPDPLATGVVGCSRDDQAAAIECQRERCVFINAHLFENWFVDYQG